MTFHWHDFCHYPCCCWLYLNLFKLQAMFCSCSAASSSSSSSASASFFLLSPQPPRLLLIFQTPFPPFFILFLVLSRFVSSSTFLLHLGACVCCEKSSNARGLAGCSRSRLQRRNEEKRRASGPGSATAQQEYNEPSSNFARAIFLKI